MKITTTINALFLKLLIRFHRIDSCKIATQYLTSMCSIFLLVFLAGFTQAGESHYHVNYSVELKPTEDSAQVTIAIENSHLLRKLDFKIDPENHSKFSANGNIEFKKQRVIWTPPKKDAELKYVTKISHLRTSGKYDALATPNWAIFRGDDLIPPVTVRALKGASSKAQLTFLMPKGWTNVDTGWPKSDNGTFLIDNPKRRFDRPVGWIIAGKVGTRRDQLSTTEISVGAPAGSSLHRMDILTFINFVWPSVERAFVKLPPKILLVGAGPPMWRGGLSASNSLFLHAERPLVSENGTSTLLHELTHVITRLKSKQYADWIVEGLAEFYSIELLYRSGGMTEQRYQKVYNWLTKWSKSVKTLHVKRSSGPTTARAVILLKQLDSEIRQASNAKYCIDDVTQELMSRSKVSLKDLQQIVKSLIGKSPKSLESSILLKNRK